MKLEVGVSVDALTALWGVQVTPPWVVNPTNAPDTFLDFANDRAWKKSGGIITPVSSLLTVARSSTKYVNDSTGAWTSVATNVLARSDLGALIEEARTNSIRNNSMQGAVAGTPGTIPTNWTGPINAGITGTTAPLALATVNGIDFIQQSVTGTSSVTSVVVQAFDAIAQIAATPGQVWTGSVFAQLLSGSLSTNMTSFDLAIREYDSGSAFLRQTLVTLQGIGASVQRVSSTVTMGASTAFVQLSIRPGYSTGPINFSVGFGWPQLELGAYVTSPIRTTSAAATRNADVITLTTPPTFGAVLSMYGQGTPQSPNSYSQPQGLILISDGTASNRVSLRRSTADPFEFINAASGVSTNIGVGNWLVGTSKRLAGATASADQQLYGSAVASATGAGNFPPVLNQVNFGSAAVGSQYLNGFLEQSAIWTSQRVPNAQLQSMTT